MSTNIWEALAAPLPKDKIEWRIDGKVMNGQARFVSYIDAHFVRERLDSVVPGQWSLHTDREADAVDKNGVVTYVYHATITIGGGDDKPVTREDVGEGESPKIAATDAFKRAAVRFGIGAELYAMGANYVKVNEKGVPLEDPQAAYERRKESGQVAHPAIKAAAAAPVGLTDEDKAVMRAAMQLDPKPSGDEPQCPKCGGAMWDDRLSKKNPKAPDFKCKKKPACDGVIWPPKGNAPAAKPVEPTYAALVADETNDSLPF